ncbi:MAG: tyrosine-type recombinase/integrase, partial [Gammaproteobacteria bacterium]
MQRRTAWIYADQAKGKRDLPVSLNDAALMVLQRCIGNHAKHVFTYRGNPVKGVDNNTWKRACRRAGIEDFRWHDLRVCEKTYCARDLAFRRCSESSCISIYTAVPALRRNATFLR